MALEEELSIVKLVINFLLHTLKNISIFLGRLPRHLPHPGREAGFAHVQEDKKTEEIRGGSGGKDANQFPTKKAIINTIN